MSRTKKNGNSSYTYRKVSYKDFKSSSIDLGKLDVKSYDEKDDEGKLTGEKGKYWNSKLRYNYDDGVGDLMLEGPLLQAQIYYAKKRKTYIDKDGKKQLGGAKYSVRLRELVGGEKDEYVKTTDDLREGTINTFIKKRYHKTTGKGRSDKLANYVDVFGYICDHPKTGDEIDESKPKQEYLDAFDGTKFYLPTKSKDEEPREMAENNYKDRLVEGKALITMKPLIKYTQLYVGANTMKAKKYLKSAIVYKVEKPEPVNFQKDSAYDPNVNIEDDIMKEFNNMVFSGKPKQTENGDTTTEPKSSPPEKQSPTEDGEKFDIKLDFE